MYGLLKSKPRIIALLIIFCFIFSGFAASLSFFIPAGLTDIISNAQAGRIPGNFAVNGNGGATYSIPIEVPPGTNGVQPNISLTYNSQAGNGLLGVGWNLSGFSAINRCSKTIASDGERTGVNFDSEDRFCLDGQRLMGFKGDYGADKTEYHTERETWIRIVSHTEPGKEGPQYFTAVTHDGHLIEFGNTDDSRIRTREQRAVRVWAVNKITDPNGNYVEMNYEENNLPQKSRLSESTTLFLGYYPKEVRYTGNSQLSPQRLVKFDYEDREDIITAYVGGAKAQINKRLAYIKTYVDINGDAENVEQLPNLVNEYRLNYEYGIATGRSRLNQVEECDAQGVCLPATKFKFFDLLNIDLSRIGSSQLGVSQDYNVTHFFIDVNGDALRDLIELGENDFGELEARVWKNTGDKEKPFLAKMASKSPLGKLYGETKYFFVDVNGDALRDLIGLGENDFGDFEVRVWENTNNEENLFPKITIKNVDETRRTNNDYFPLDINGNGLTDLIELWNSSGNFQIRIWKNRSNEKKPFSAEEIETLGRWPKDPQAEYFPLDINGNGLTDLIELSIEGGQFQSRTWISTHNTSKNNEEKSFSGRRASVLGFFGGSNTRNLTADVNGDSLKDLIELRNDDGRCEAIVWVNRGDENNTFTERSVSLLGGWSQGGWDEKGNRYVTADINGDGLTDLIELFIEKGQFQSRTWIGKSENTNGNEENSFLGGSIVELGDYNNNIDHFTADINGDGLTDLIELSKEEGQFQAKFWGLANQNHGSIDLLSNIENGLNEKIKIEYKPLTDKTVYRKGSGETYPKVDVQNSMYVVSKHAVEDNLNGANNQFIYEHKYKGAKIDLHRGWSGFEKTISLDLQNKTKTINTYSTEFPLLGMILSEEILHDQNILGKVITKYGAEKSNKGIYKVWKELVKSEYYTEGNKQPDYILEQDFEYDSDYRNVVRISDLGDDKDSRDNIYTCTKFYDATNREWWKGFIPIQQKLVRSESECNNPEIWNRWNSNIDLKWEKFDYDPRMNLISRSQYLDRYGINSNAEKWLVSRSAYDAYGNVISTTDPLGNTSIISFDSRYHTFPVKYTTPKINIINQPLETIVSYEPKFGIKTSVTDPNKNKIMEIPERGIDGFGRVVEVRGIKPDTSEMVSLAKSEFTRKSNGMSIKNWYRTKWDNDDLNTWLWTEEDIDSLGREFQVKSKGLNEQIELISKVEFNKKGQVEREYLPYYSNNVQNAKFTSYKYDIRGQVTQVTSPNKSVATTDYSKQFSERRITNNYPNPSDNSLENNFISSTINESSRGWITQKIAPDLNTATYEYDLLGRVVKITDPLGEETTLTYNSLGKVISETNPETGTKKYIYNDNGNLVNYIDAKNQKISFEYDNLGRTTKKILYEKKQDQKPTQLVTYEFDNPLIENSKEKLTKISITYFDDLSKNVLIYSFKYDNFGKIKEEKLDIDGNQNSFISKYTYDAAGRPETITYPDGAIVRYTYNYQGEIENVDLKDVDRSNFVNYAVYDNYTPLGNFERVKYKNGVESEYQYDEIGRITNSKTFQANLTYLNFTYEWNKANNLLKIDDKTDKKLSENFEYNNVARLISANGPYPSQTYSYDVAGNITELNREKFEYNPRKKHQLISAQYDANGNTEAYSPWSYKYDIENRLIQVGNGNKQNINSFTYDDSGNRLIKVDSDGKKTYYVSPTYEVVEIPSASETQTIHTKYVTGPQGVIAAISKDGNQVNLLTEKHNNLANFREDYFNVFSINNLPNKLYGIIFKIFDSHNFGELLTTITLLSSLLFAIFLWTSQLILSASTESWAGKGRTLILKILVQFKFISFDTANLISRPKSSTWLLATWQRPGLFALGFVAYSTINLTGTSFIAELIPGKNGAGYPESAQTIFIHHGHLGSTNLVTDENGREISLVNYKPYGEVADSSKGKDNFRSKFTGKEFDRNIDLYYFGSRYYNAGLGRFLTPDPSEQYFSPYVYGDSNPLNGVDPNGEAFFTLSLLVGTALLGGAYAGGAAVNDNFNPSSWDWNSAKNWAGVIGGAAIGGLAVGFGIAAPGVIASATGISSTAASIPLSGGIMGAMNASFTGMAGGNVEEVSSAFGLGLGMGALFATPGIGALAFLGSVGYNTSNVIADPSVENGIALAMDLIDLGITVVPRLRRGGSCSSFAAGTLVLSSEGEKVIEDVEVGDMVWAYDEQKGEEALYPVSHLFTRIASELVLVNTGDEVIEATPEHEFYVDSLGWVKAENLNIGDKLVEQGDNNMVTVISLHSIKEEVRVYNFEVEHAHTYYVSTEKLLVHNYAPTPCGVRTVRRDHGVPAEKNIAIVDLQINGDTVFNNYAVSHQSRDQRYGGIEMPRLENDSFRRVFQADPNYHQYDSEVHLLEHIDQVVFANIGNPNNVSGVLYLHSGFNICESCRGVIGQFSVKYPNIEIITSRGEGHNNFVLHSGSMIAGWWERWWDGHGQQF